MGRPPAHLARDTRRAIAEAALDLFAERGFHATSMRALAAAVGVRESALYHHFASKEAILEALFAERPGNSGPAVDLFTELAGQPLPEVLRRLGEEILRVLDSPSERKLIRLATALGAASGEQNLPFHRGAEWRKAFVRLLGELQRAGRARRDVDADLLFLQFTAPLVVATGTLYGGRRLTQMPMQKFLKQHITCLVRGAGR